MKVFILCAILAFVSTTPIQSRNNDGSCLIKGPSYWCINKQTATQCGATSYCKQNVWNKIPEDDICQECKTTITMVHELLENNDTKAKAMEMLQKICALLPKEYQSVCKTSYDRILKLTADAGVFCTEIGVCSGTKAALRKMKLLRIIAKGIKEFQKPRTDDCTLCEQYVGTVYLLISNNETRNEILNELTQICITAGLKQAECSILVDVIGVKLLDALVNYLADPSKLCTTLGLCPAMKHALLQNKSQKNILHLSRMPNLSPAKKLTFNSPKDSELCEICKDGVNYIDGLLKDNSTQEALKAAVLSLCQDLPDSLKSECNQYVNEYWSMAMKLILQALSDPQELCTELHVCNATKASVNTRKPIKASPVTCEVCEYAMKYLDGILSDNATEAEVRAALDDMCDYLPASVKDQCTSLVNTYTDMIVKLIVQELAQPAEVCKELGLCSASMKVHKNIPVLTKQKMKTANPVTCEVCEYAMKYLDGILSDNATEVEVRAALDDMCAYLPASVKDQCTSLVNTYTDMIVKLIVQELAQPAEVCKELGLCSASLKVSTNPIQSRNNDETCSIKGPSYWCINKQTATQCGATSYCKQNVWNKIPEDDICQECKTTITMVHELLENNDTKAKAMEMLQKICALLPKEYQSVCKTSYDRILNLTADAGAFCTEIGVCSGTKAALRKMKLLRIIAKGIKEFQKPRTDDCTLCEQYVGTVYLLISNNETRNEILNELTQICITAGLKQAECSILVDVIGVKLLDALVNYLADPSKLCTTLGLCPAMKHALLQNKSQKNILHLSKMPNLSLAKKANLRNCDSTCTICLQIVEFVQDVLNDSTVRNVLKDVAENACSFMPPQIFSRCLDFVINRLPKYYNRLVELLNPNSTCAVLNLCNSTCSLKNTNKLTFNSPKDSELCEICKDGVNYIDGLLKDNSTQEALKAAVLSLCQDLPDSLKSECNQYVNEYWSMAMKLILQALSDPQELCTELHVCKATKASVNTRKPIKANPVTCEVCEYAMKYLDGILSDNATEAEVRAALDDMCNYLPASVKDQCTSLVNTYTDMIVKLIVQELAQPAEVCKELGLCSASMKVHKNIPVLTKQKMKTANPVTCEVCEYAMKYLDGILSDNATEAEVRAALDDMCNYLPASVKDQCTSLVNTYTDMIVKLIVQELAQPAEVCKELGLCSASAKVHKNIPVLTKQKMKTANPVTCEVCEYAMKYLDGILSDNATEAEVRAALDDMCNYLPASVKDQCTSLVNTYTDMIVKLIVQELAQPAEVCKELGLCSASMKVKKNIPAVLTKQQMKTANPTTCELCEYAMQYLDGILGDNATAAEVRAALDVMCAYLPTSLEKQCTSFVDKYEDVIIKLIVQELAQPAEVCKELGLCSSSSKVIKNKGVTGDDFCEVCEDAVEVVDNLLKENRTKEAIDGALEHVCNYFKGSTKAVCVQLIETYGGDLIDLLANQLKPDVICKTIRVCPSSKSKLSTAKLTTKATPSCNLCNFVMGQLITDLKDNKTDEEIRQVVLNICTKLPTHINDECKHLVEEYGDIIVKAIIAEVTPDAVCEFIGLCTEKYTSKTRKHMLEMRLALDGVSCEVCEVGLGYLDSLLTKNSTETEIKNLVVDLCSHLPSEIKNECDALITEYGNELIKLIAQQIKPDEICKALKIC